MTKTPSLKREYRQMEAARAMLAALKHTADWIAKTTPATTFAPRDMLKAAIAQAEAAGVGDLALADDDYARRERNASGCQEDI